MSKITDPYYLQQARIYSVWWYKTKIGVIDLKTKSITVGKRG